MTKLKKVPGALVWFEKDLYVITGRYYVDWIGEDTLTLEPITGTQECCLILPREVRLLKEPADGN